MTFSHNAENKIITLGYTLVYVYKKSEFSDMLEPTSYTFVGATISVIINQIKHKHQTEKNVYFFTPTISMH